MFKKIFYGFAFVFIVFSLTLSMAAPALAQDKATAQTTKERCDKFKAQFNLSNGQNVVGDLPAVCSASSLAQIVINAGFGFAATVAVLFLIEGGYFYMASGGNEETAEKGKKILINAAMGLGVIIMSFAIVRIVADLLGKSY